MSLGYNSLPPRRTSTLPGSVGASAVYRRPRVARAKTASPPVRSPVAPARPTPAPALPPTSSPAPPPAPPPAALDDGAPHWIYATAAHALVDEDTGDEVAAAGARLLLVYPMESDAETGRVRMRLKTADPVTGQLAYAWVCVCDPEAGVRGVTEFAMVP